MELGTIIVGNGLEHSLVFFNCLNTGRCYLFCSSGGDFLDDKKFCFAFNKSHNTVMAVVSDTRLWIIVFNEVKNIYLDDLMEFGDENRNNDFLVVRR